MGTQPEARAKLWKVAFGVGEVAGVLAVLDAVPAAVEEHHQRQAARDGELQARAAILALPSRPMLPPNTREVLREDDDRPAVDQAGADDDAVGRRQGACRRRRGAVAILGRDQPADLGERACVEQPVDPGAGAQRAALCEPRHRRTARLVHQGPAHRLDAVDQIAHGRVVRHRRSFVSLSSSLLSLQRQDLRTSDTPLV